MKNSYKRSKRSKRILAAVIFSAALCLSSCSGQGGDVTDTAEAEETTSTSVSGTTETSAETSTETSAETFTETSAETTAETEPEVTFESDEAEKYYNIITNDLSWRKSDVVGATILDVHGDGIPEFLVVRADEENNVDMVDCYSFGGEKLELMYSFEDFSYGKLTKYVDGGRTKWWGSTYSYEQEDESNMEFSETGMRMLSYKNEETYGLFEFTENGPVMTDKKFYNITEYDRETDIYQGKMYTDGELYGTDYIEEYSLLDGAPDLTYYGWFTSKAEWEGEHLTSSENYNLAPNTYYGRRTDIRDDDCLIKLVNAYCQNDKEYLTVDQNFGDVAAFKPVIYLYPTETAEVSVRLSLDGHFTCTYPDYGTGWQVTAKPDGTLYDKRDGNEYSYLYWEAALNADWDMTKGFVVEGKDTAEFLREKLSYMGLTPREYNEFIVYWLPQMQDNRYNLITFQTDEYTDAAKLDISPAPDSLLRVFMVYRPLDEFAEVEEQELSTFERNGFTVVEWGGTEF